ncbi:hypothetical protein PTKIN_Ptkin01aG0242000 [Pterospermum kingtungense]
MELSPITYSTSSLYPLFFSPPAKTSPSPLIPHHQRFLPLFPTTSPFAPMGHQISQNKFDIPSCCVRMDPPTPSGEPLVLPNLKLKVFIEAIRMVLEIVYDEKFVTFSYGGRVGMGRHTAIRYLKNNVTNPSWWFNVSFCPNKFDEFNVHKLCLFIGDKIKDGMLIDVIKKLFACQVFRVELVGGYLGRGFPQESGLCSILINVYFDGFDREVQKMRLQMNRENRKFELTKLDLNNSNVFYKPVKMYAVRTWADEVVKEFLGSLEERWNWHRLLSRGDFLSLRHVRDQLPQDLVDPYDKFQEQVDKHLTPVKARIALEEEERRVREEEEQKYSEHTLDDLTKLCMKVSVPIELVKKAVVRMAGFTNNMGRPRPISLLFALEDADIVKWYAGVGRRWLDFFCCCHNFNVVKAVVSYRQDSLVS